VDFKISKKIIYAQFSFLTFLTYGKKNKINVAKHTNLKWRPNSRWTYWTSKRFYRLKRVFSKDCLNLAYLFIVYKK
jgi:hypothetical protein